jgi:SOS-response transcriptional repressor LexA
MSSKKVTDTNKSKTIEEIRKSLGLTRAEFAKKIGVTDKYVYMLEAGLKTPSNRLLDLIELRFSSTVFESNKEMPRYKFMTACALKDTDANNFLLLLKELGESDRQSLWNFALSLRGREEPMLLIRHRNVRDWNMLADALVDHPSLVSNDKQKDVTVALPGKPLRRIPILSPVAAGRWRPMQDPYPVGQGFDEIETSEPGQHLYGLRVDGDSMEPAYHDGETILVNPELPCDEPGVLVIVRRDDEDAVVFKQFKLGKKREPLLHSLNPKYADIPMLPGDQCRGRVVWPKRKHK